MKTTDLIQEEHPSTEEEDEYITITLGNETLKVYDIENSDLIIQQWITKRRKPILLTAEKYPSTRSFNEVYGVNLNLDTFIELHKFRLRKGGKALWREVQVNTNFKCRMIDFLVEFERILILRRYHKYAKYMQSKAFFRMKQAEYLAPNSVTIIHDQGAKYGVIDGEVQTQAQFMGEGFETICTEGFFITGRTEDIDLSDYQLMDRPIPEGKKFPEQLTFGHFVLTTDKADDSVYHDCSSKKVLEHPNGLKRFEAKRVNDGSDNHPTVLKNVNGLAKKCKMAKKLELEALGRFLSSR